MSYKHELHHKKLTSEQRVHRDFHWQLHWPSNPWLSRIVDTHTDGEQTNFTRCDNYKTKQPWSDQWLKQRSFRVAKNFSASVCTSLDRFCAKLEVKRKTQRRQTQAARSTVSFARTRSSAASSHRSALARLARGLALAPRTQTTKATADPSRGPRGAAPRIFCL